MKMLRQNFAYNKISVTKKIPNIIFNQNENEKNIDLGNIPKEILGHN
jgi:hypothetical protein